MLYCNFNKVAFEITLWHGCSPINLLHIFRAPFYKNTSGWLFLTLSMQIFMINLSTKIVRDHSYAKFSENINPSCPDPGQQVRVQGLLTC